MTAPAAPPANAPLAAAAAALSIASADSQNQQEHPSLQSFWNEINEGDIQLYNLEKINYLL